MATQSGVGLGGAPGRAIDGNTSGQWNDGFVELYLLYLNPRPNETKIDVES